MQCQPDVCRAVIAAQPPRHFDSARVGHRNVEQDEAELLRQGRHSASAPRRRTDTITLALQNEFQNPSADHHRLRDTPNPVASDRLPELPRIFCLRE